MRVEEKIYANFQEFYQDILPTGKLGEKFTGFIFRGESTSEYKLLPVALRPQGEKQIWLDNNEDLNYEYIHILGEYILLKKFYYIANNSGLKIPKSKLLSKNYIDTIGRELENIVGQEWINDDIEDLAALAQHHGVATRLLDWTHNIHVAMYFASSGACKKDKNNKYMVVWCMNSFGMHHLKSMGDIQIKFVTPSYYNNKNIGAQKGILSYWPTKIETLESIFYNIDLSIRAEEHRKNTSLNELLHEYARRVDRTPLNELISNYKSMDENNVYLYRLLIPATDCYTMFNFISKLGYNASSLFPGYDGVKRQLDEERILLENMS